MYNSVQFLFLLSLAVFSWAILCYFKELEKLIKCSPMAQAPDEDRFGPNEEHRQKFRSSQCHNNYESYWTYVYIFACIHVLVKVVHIVSKYVARRMYYKWYVCNDKIFSPQMSGIIIRVAGENVENILRQQVEELTKQNQQLQLELKRCEVDNPDRSVDKSPLPGDVPITNHYLHMKKKIYMNSNEVNRTEIQNYSEEPGMIGDTVKTERKTYPEKILNENSSVWQNYMVQSKEIASNIQSLLASNYTNSPLIISTEDLQKCYEIA